MKQLNILLKQLNIGNFVAFINCDLSKDSQIKSLGIRGTSLDMLESYLSGRLQYTEIKYVGLQGDITSHRSRLVANGFGVPQEILDPLPFIIYIIDLAANISGLVTLYAHDTNIVIGAPNPQPLRKLLHKDTAWDWNIEQDQALTKLKDALTTFPVLGYYDVNDEVLLSS
ncbi:hypothetical protein QE152_g5248 [Popillia japonica]|uniref:Uncharacterized protein n=1 Tax=Popillia japonica TaxID=7064 RepID=A0AAW1MPB9_POPJA